MKAFARFTAVIFILFGVLIILGGVAFAFSGPAPQMPQGPMSGLIPDLTGIIVLAKIAGGGVIGIQGLFLTAFGQALWLLANIQDQTERTDKALLVLMMKNNPPKS
jgi:hypothetical protein